MPVEESCLKYSKIFSCTKSNHQRPGCLDHIFRCLCRNIFTRMSWGVGHQLTFRSITRYIPLLYLLKRQGFFFMRMQISLSFTARKIFSTMTGLLDGGHCNWPHYLLYVACQDSQSRFMAQVYRAFGGINLILGTNFTQKFTHLLFIMYCMFLHKSFLEYGRMEKIIICGGGGRVEGGLLVLPPILG